MVKRFDRFYQCIIVFTLATYLFYLIYRLLYTINSEALFISFLFYYAEIHGFMALFLYFFQIWHPLKRKVITPQPAMSVDVYIPTYNEDISLVRKTIIACIEMEYSHKTYILDDGHRPEMAEMAEELGCGYIKRYERKDAKAGNLNNALFQTDGDFLVIFDADYVPHADFLQKTLGYFQDEKVAFVQTPHNYYNIDSFQFKFNKKKDDLWNEADIFYRLMMPGRDYWDSTFFAGTSAIFRKKALKELGGFSTDTITEDLQTTINLYKRGWKGIYHNEILSNGLAAKDIKNYHIQKLRWAEGNVSLLFKDNPLFIKNLSFPQKICFFATIFGWFVGLPQFIYFITPAIILLTGQYPIVPFDWAFIKVYLLFLTIIIVGFKIASRGYGKIWHDEVYNMMNFFVLIKAVLKNIFKFKSGFIVTGKGTGESVHISNIAPQLVLIIACFSGIIWGILKLFYGVSWEIKGITVASFWACMNGLLAISVIKDITVPQNKRMDFRFPICVPVKYTFDGEKEASVGYGFCRDINEHGISLSTFKAIPIGEKFSLELHMSVKNAACTMAKCDGHDCSLIKTCMDKKILKCKGDVLYFARNEGPDENIFNYGVKFEKLSKKEEDFISNFCFNAMLPRFFQKFENKQSFFMKVVFWISNRNFFMKRSDRQKINLSLVLKEDPPVYAVTEDVSATGISFISPIPMPEDKCYTIEILSPFGKMAVEIRVKRTKVIAPGQFYFIGAEFKEFIGNSRSIVSQVIGKKEMEAEKKNQKKLRFKPA